MKKESKNLIITASGGGDDRGEVQQTGEKQKLGHRRIDEQGEASKITSCCALLIVSYKKVPTNALMSAIQLGIANSIGSLASRPDRDLLLQDFEKIENVAFPAAGSATTPSHSFGDFRFKTYAPIAFRYFRELFNIKPADFLSLGKNIRLLVMNNLLPQNVTMHEKYDLKGSTYKRLASKAERAKVLESFKIMDYSLLVGIHNVELASGGRGQAMSIRQDSEDELEQVDDLPSTSRGESTEHEQRKRPLQTKFSVWDQSEFEGSVPPGGVPARNSNGDRLILFLGIIDILQNYRLLKKMEHTWKAILHDGDSISVHNPNFYAQRFLTFMTEHVFKKGPADARKANGKFRTLVHSYLALKQSPSRRRARKSIGDEDAPISTRDINPVINAGVPRTAMRTAHRTNSDKKEKKYSENAIGSRGWTLMRRSSLNHFSNQKMSRLRVG
ncbi:1-phosphatidylinositol-4-phosphate 5-kinase [Ancylostoma ceylanicum]|uniref:1-phosphatidylinositol-4-phosphate 5-kinase n=1 Tax=Ancylostoma ceylanicum TaxID=53326 RepID=A0A0D6LRX5_9BILA|nr:1-phosphatidylinositol-4-phosphate 5-kinase [Ancylostoma ceylanicum]